MGALVHIPPIPAELPPEVQALIKEILDNLIRLEKEIGEHDKRLKAASL